MLAAISGFLASRLHLPTILSSLGLHNNTLSHASLCHLALPALGASSRAGSPRPRTHRTLSLTAHTPPIPCLHRGNNGTENYIWLWEPDLPSQIWLFKDGRDDSAIPKCTPSADGHVVTQKHT